MAVAPVTDWRFYDSVYTERYMALPTEDDNSLGYVNASVSSMEGFSNADFALAHGCVLSSPLPHARRASFH